MAEAMPEKVLLVNRQALQAKYGNGAAAVLQALDELVKADEERGLSSAVIGIDDAADLAPFRATPVVAAGDEASVKLVVDDICAALQPHYVVLVGSVDLIPHQTLTNPMPDPDPDANVPSDLPYACDRPYSTDPADFIAPTRVVGRIPDLTGVGDPSYLLALLGRIKEWQPLPADAYRSGFALSAEVWRDSTTLSATNLFGPTATVELSPPDGPQWDASLLSRPAHFINCHGAGADPHFYGQHDEDYPVAHDAQLLGAVGIGTVAAAECCYGAELYDPSLTSGVAGICTSYLERGAFGFCGSSNVAYGPAAGNGSADLLTQYFIRSVQTGASLGRALLEARQEFVRNVSVVDPADLKTLAQFLLLGDPSIYAEAPPQGGGVVGDAVSPKSAAVRVDPGAERSLRRQNLALNGAVLAESTAVARNAHGTDPSMFERLVSLIDVDRGYAESRSFTVSEPVLRRRMKAVRQPPGAAEIVHVLVARTRARGGAGGAVDAIARTVAVVALEQDGEVVSWRTLFAR
jgi:hypothetical protein